MYARIPASTLRLLQRIKVTSLVVIEPRLKQRGFLLPKNYHAILFFALIQIELG